MSKYYLRVLPSRKVKVVNRDPFNSKNLESDIPDCVVENCDTNNTTKELQTRSANNKESPKQAPQGDCRDQELPSEDENWEEEDYLPLRELLFNQPPINQLPMDQPQPEAGAPAQVIPPNANAPQAQPQINPMALSFKPPTFNGLHPESANRWWQSFARYADLAGIQGNARCNLLGLLLCGSADIWFNSLPLQTRTDFAALEADFCEKYITAAHTQLQRQMAVLSRLQSPGETVDVTDARSKMVNYNYDNELQMTLLIHGLRISPQNARHVISGFLSC